MAASVNIHEAKTNFSKLVRRADEVWIGPDFDQPLEEFSDYEG
ncbi:MAG TPA: hypothetical protein VHZ54_16625 [Solirubrobacterales bacterium]|jgi:hypothetical protein|nr:hypothetical protein [Solirubrobacterales bacterium]